MKKIVLGIAAVAMAASMFAAEPAFSGNVASYSGEASVTWGVNIDDKQTGFNNAESASMKVNIFNGGDKATSGDGIWAEIKIKNDGVDKEDTESFVVPDVVVDVAKFHIYDVYIGIRSGDTQVGGCKPQTAIVSSNYGIDAVGTSKTKGIVVGYADDNFGIDVDFRSEPETATDFYSNDYGIAAEASFKEGNKLVNGLEVKAGVSYAFNDSNSLAYAASSSYKIAIDDTYYVKPTVAYTSANEIVGAVLFAWGAEADANAGVFFLDDDAAKKVTPGVSVIYKNDFDTSSAGNMKVAFNLGSLVDNLKLAALMEANLDTFADSVAVKGGASYEIAAGDVKITSKAGASYAKDNLLVKVGADFGGVINNTTFSVLWTSGNLLASTPVIGTVDLTAKIAL